MSVYTYKILYHFRLQSFGKIQAWNMRDKCFFLERPSIHGLPYLANDDTIYKPKYQRIGWIVAITISCAFCIWMSLNIGKKYASTHTITMVGWYLMKIDVKYSKTIQKHNDFIIWRWNQIHIMFPKFLFLTLFYAIITKYPKRIFNLSSLFCKYNIILFHFISPFHFFVSNFTF